MKNIKINEFTSNKINVVHVETDSSFTDIMFYVGVGSFCETAKKKGSAHFLEHMLFKGTETRTWEDINEEAAYNAIGHNAYTNNFETAYTASVHNSHVNEALDLLTDQLFNSTFPKKELDMEKTVIHEECEMYLNDPSSIYFDAVRRELLNKQLKTPIIGTHDTIQGITRKDIVNFRAKYGTNNTTLIITSSLELSDVKKLCKKYLKRSNLVETKDTAILPKLISDYDDKELNAPNCQGTQSRIGMFFNSPPLGTTPIEFHIMMEVLHGGMNSILFKNIREEQGLCYSIYGTPYLNTVDDGTYVIMGMTKPENKETYKESVINCIKALSVGGISQHQFESAVNNQIDSILRTHEMPDALMSTIGKYRVNGIDPNIINSLEAELASVTIEDVNHYIQDFFCEDFFESKFYTWIVQHN
jgi:predicted Zn-dependent peptidase